MIYMRSFKGRRQIQKWFIPVNLKDFCTYEYISPKNNNILFAITEDFRVRKLAKSLHSNLNNIYLNNLNSKYIFVHHSYLEDPNLSVFSIVNQPVKIVVRLSKYLRHENVFFRRTAVKKSRLNGWTNSWVLLLQQLSVVRIINLGSLNTLPRSMKI